MQRRENQQPVSDSLRANRGQSLVIAVIVLFLLLFLGGVFVALVARNLRSAQRMSDVSSASGLSEAGLRYLDEQLVNSPEGADWRPIPENITNERDPDYAWLKPCVPDTNGNIDEPCGYTRVAFGESAGGNGKSGGRALVKITYNPIPGDSGNDATRNSRYYRLDSIGRVGVIDTNDPTTFGNTEAVGLRRELVAYKDVSLVNYLRYVTNKDGKPMTAALGASNVVLDRPNQSQLDPPASRDIPSYYAGPIRVDGDLTFYGPNYFLLDPSRNDAIEVAGQIQLDRVDPNATAAQLTAGGLGSGRVYIADPTTGNFPQAANPNLLPSQSPDFTTLDGLVRDNAPGTDAGGVPRQVRRIEPPVLDNTIGPRGLTRYRALTRDSAPLADKYTGSNPVNPVFERNDYAGTIGWGENIYIANNDDVQTESENLFGAHSLRTEWLNQQDAASRSPYWNKGDFTYSPPGVVLNFHPRYVEMESVGRYRFRRPDNGQPVNDRRIVRYTPVPGANAPSRNIRVFPNNIFAGYPADPTPTNPNVLRSDQVIYLEGNVRVRGTIGGVDPEAPNYAFERHVTVVTNGTAYIDGNVIRDNVTPALAGSNGAARIVKGRSSIAILARDYVCVNTTQFLHPQDDTDAATEENSEKTPTRDLTADKPAFPFGLTLAPVDADNTPPGYLVGGGNNAPELSVMMRYAGVGAPGTVAAVNLFVNPSLFPLPVNTVGDPGLFYFTNPVQNSVNPFTLLTVPFDPSNPQQIQLGGPVFLSQQFGFAAQNLQSLTGPQGQGTAAFGSSIGTENPMQLALDVSANPSVGDTGAAFYVTRIGIAPLDVRIEAFLYAQEGSFFVIPGPWFNPNPNDTYDNYRTAGKRSEDIQVANPNPYVDHAFPFYRQPMDIRITFFGGIAENLTARIADQSAWMEKWGWVPNYFGSTGLPGAGITAPNALQSVHGPLGTLSDPAGRNVSLGNGIFYSYDDRGVLPYGRGADTSALRQDIYGNVLPVAPRLPMAPGFLYVGENTTP